MTPAAILQLETISHQFANQLVPVVHQISLTLHQGDILSLLGPSGCGKTTLLRLIAGFERPQTGRIVLAGQTVVGDGCWLPPEQRDVGMVFQDYALFPHLTVAENIAFGLRNRYSSKRATPKRADKSIADQVAAAIALVGLQGKGDRYPHQLSGGQQQRVALARALAPQPTLILLDEPLSNLDMQVRVHLRHEVRRILKATGTSGIFVTHDQEEALSISDQVAVMQQGHLEQIGTPESIYQTPASPFAAMFVAQANLLPAEWKEYGWKTEAGFFPANPPSPARAKGTLMLRQEDLILEPDAMGEVVVSDRHFLGREYSYYLSTASGQEIRARTGMDVVLPVGTSVKLSARSQDLTVFPL
jgi:iron(III) transport system ATP-binding protein